MSWQLEEYLVKDLESVKWKLEEKLYIDITKTEDYKSILEDIDNAIDKLKKIIDLERE